MDEEQLKKFTKEHQTALENITSFMVHNRIIEFEINDGGKDADVALIITFVGDDYAQDNRMHNKRKIYRMYRLRI